jgi:hypothetical protein
MHYDPRIFLILLLLLLLLLLQLLLLVMHHCMNIINNLQHQMMTADLLQPLEVSKLRNLKPFSPAVLSKYLQMTNNNQILTYTLTS